MGEKQGLDADKWYEALVVANDDRKHPDKMMLGRIQARIGLIFDGIGNVDLPWAIPVWDHPDGASPISGMFNVPKVGSKVLLRFQQCNPSFPMYRGFHVDMSTQMEETKFNYPHRKVLRCLNKALLIVDTKDNVCYIRNPGNLKIYIDGNVSIEVNGNIDELINGSVRRMIKGDLDETVVGDVSRTIVGSLNETTYGDTFKSARGDISEEFDGSREIHTTGNYTESVDGNVRKYCKGSALYEAAGTFSIEAASIHENSGNAKGHSHATNSGNQVNTPARVATDNPAAEPTYSGTNKGMLEGLLGSRLGAGLRGLIGKPKFPQQPIFFKWPGVPGLAKGTNGRDKTTKESAGQPAKDKNKDTTPSNVNSSIGTYPEKPHVPR